MTLRRQRALVALIATVGLLRGMWWVVATPLWSPIDEQAHYDFVEAMGRLEGPPLVGADRVHRDVLEVAKHSSTSPWQSVPVPPDPARPEWHALAQSYEAAQPPLYYATLAPVWKLASGARTVATIYALRIASLLVSLLLVPLVWLLGRELFPQRAEIGVASAAVVVALSGVNGNFAIVANDGLMTVLSAAVLLAVARVIQRGFTTRRAVVIGALVGAAVLTKLTAVALVGVVAVGILVAARRHRLATRRALRFGVIAASAAAVLVAPWVVFNLAHYDGFTASKQLDAITGSLQSDPAMNLGGLATRLRQAGHGFWDQQLLDTTVSRYAWLWFGFAALAGAVAFVGRRAERPVLVWLYAAWPIAFVTMAFVVLGISGGRSDIAGRHLYVALPALVVAVVAATFLVGGRWAVVVLAAVCAVGLTFEASDEPGVTRGIYSQGAFGNLTPVVDRPYADRLVDGARFEVVAPCPVVAARLVFRDAAPTVMVNGRATQPFTPEPGPARTAGALYAVAGGQHTVVLEVPTDAQVAASRAGPALQVLCVRDHNSDARFAQAFRRGHLPLTRAQVALVPQAWAVVGWMLVAVALARSIGRWGGSGSGSGDGSQAPPSSSSAAA